MSALSFDGVGFALGGATLLHDVRFELQPQELWALLGPNGAGKSTLLRVALGVIRAGSGRVLLGGVDAATLSTRERAQRIAWVPQSPAEDTGFTALELVLMGRAPHLGSFGLPSQKDVAEAHALLDEVGLQALAARPLNEMSGGERRLCYLARARMQKAPVLLFDEPTAFLRREASGDLSAAAAGDDPRGSCSACGAARCEPRRAVGDARGAAQGGPRAGRGTEGAGARGGCVERAVRRAASGDCRRALHRGDAGVKKTGLSIAVSVALHLVLAAGVFALAPRKSAATAAPSASAALPVATRVSLFPRPVERSVARAEAPPRRLRVVKAAAVVASSEPAATAGTAAAPDVAATPVDAVPALTAGGAGNEPAAVPAAAAVAPARTVDIGALHAALAASALRCYPAAARRFNLTGEVTVDFCLEPSGALRSATLAGTTGQDILDAAARECVVTGALPLPAEAFGGCYAVPVRFGR